MRFRDLGPLLVEIDGVSSPPGGRKPAAILGLLLVNANRRVSVDTVMEGVWGDRVTEGTASTLESHIWRLRRVLEPNRGAREAPSVLINDSGGYRLLATDDQVDSVRFEALATEARELLSLDRGERALQICDDALDLWRGTPYDVAADAPWAESAAARLGELRDQLRERRIDALLATGRTDEALTDVDALIDRMPFREHLWGQRMLALYRAGRSEESLSTFQRARTTLLDELGIEPGPELRDLQTRILDQDDELAAPRVSVTAPRPAAEVHLPTMVTPLVGRDEAVAQLRPLVESSRVVTVAGAAGCGKTRLAIEIARMSAPAFPDGVWFVDLGAVGEPDVVVEVVVSSIGIAPGAAGSPQDSLRAYCRDRRLLVLLDNCEHVLAAAADVVETVLGDDGASCVLTTSREPLGVDGEAIWTLGPLDVPSEDPVHDADGLLATARSAPAMELFLSRIASADPARELSDEDVRTAAEICVAVDGVPLALELAAARVRSSTLTEIAAQVTADASDLSRIGRGPEDHRRTVHATIDWSHRLLTPSEQALHRRVSVLPGAFTREAAAAVVAGADGVGAADVAELLAMLVHRSLLVSGRSARPGGPMLYRQLATVRGHAERELEAAGETAATLDRRDAWVRALLAARPRLGGHDVDGWYDRVDDSFAIVRSALRRGLVDRPDEATVRALTRLDFFWYFRSRMGEADRWLALGLAADVDPHPLDVVMIRLSMSAAVTIRGRSDLAQDHTEAALRGLADLADADDVDRLVDIGEHIGGLAIAIAPLQATGVIAILAEQVRGLAELTGDPALAVLADALVCMTDSTKPDRDGVAERSVDIYERAVAEDHLIAAWIAAGTRMVLAIRTADPDLMRWTSRAFLCQVQQGGEYTGLFLESAGTAAYYAQDHLRAVRLYSASRAAARRAGTTWPRQPPTPAFLDLINSALGRPAYDEAWREGTAFTVDQVLELAESYAR